MLDVNNEEGKNSLANNENNKNIKDEVNKATKDLEDLLKTGTKENLNEKIQQLKQQFLLFLYQLQILFDLIVYHSFFYFFIII